MIQVFDPHELPYQATTTRDTEGRLVVKRPEEVGDIPLPQGTKVWLLRGTGVRRASLQGENCYALFFARSPAGREILVDANDFEPKV